MALPRSAAVRILVYAPGCPVSELAAGQKKAALFEDVFGMAVTVEYAGAGR